MPSLWPKSVGPVTKIQGTKQMNGNSNRTSTTTPRPLRRLVNVAIQLMSLPRPAGEHRTTASTARRPRRPCLREYHNDATPPFSLVQCRLIRNPNDEGGLS